MRWCSCGSVRRFREREFALAPSLRFISQIGRGIPHLDLAAATRRGIVVSCTPNDSGASTAELTFALMLALARQIPWVSEGMRRAPGRRRWVCCWRGGPWASSAWDASAPRWPALEGAFDLDILATGKTLTDERAAEAGARRVSLETLLEESDVVSVNCRLNAETTGLISGPELRRMKPGALLINTARGPIISEAALIESLKRGGIRAGSVSTSTMKSRCRRSIPCAASTTSCWLPTGATRWTGFLHQRYQSAFANVIGFIRGAPVNVINPEA